MTSTTLLQYAYVILLIRNAQMLVDEANTLRQTALPISGVIVVAVRGIVA
ncbi:hypothetical protein MAHJHV30_22760 [Mycobacterium avium subsp. hominissuis]